MKAWPTVVSASRLLATVIQLMASLTLMVFYPSFEGCPVLPTVASYPGHEGGGKALRPGYEAMPMGVHWDLGIPIEPHLRGMGRVFALVHPYSIPNIVQNVYVLSV